MITKPVITKRFTLSGSERLKSRKLIAAVFSQGRGISLPLPLLRAVFLPVTEHGQATLQAGFSASSRNFKRAVDRNRIKRLMREAYRREKHILEELLQQKNESLALFIIYTGKQVPDYDTVHGQTLELIRLLAKKLNRPARERDPGETHDKDGFQDRSEPYDKGGSQDRDGSQGGDGSRDKEEPHDKQTGA